MPFLQRVVFSLLNEWSSSCASGVPLELVSLYSASSGSQLFAPRFDSLLWMQEAACGSSVTKEITSCSASCHFMDRRLQMFLWGLAIMFIKKKIFFPLLMSQPHSRKQWKVGLVSRMLLLDQTDTIIITFLFPFSCWVNPLYSLYTETFLLLIISVSWITCAETSLDSAMKLF